MSEQRSENLDKVRRNGAFDVAVIGGGINGIGVFRELALQGLRVLLVERNDFCSGCSAAPSRMIHGGLRYLENGEFSLVQESLRERDALLANAPHMVRPLPTTIPIRSIFSGLMNGVAGLLGLSETPSSRGALAIKAGLALYDWTTRRRRVLPRHQFLSARQTFDKWPDLDPELRCSATYHDAWISYPERLGIELLLDTADSAPLSVAVNRAEILPLPGCGFELADKESGERFAVSARVVVNATGAWLDEAIAQLDSAGTPVPPLVEGTKGSHLVLDNQVLHDALGGHMIFYENADGRVCVIFPYLGKVLAGSTDIRVNGPDRVRCEPDEKAYILEAVSAVFPSIPVRASDVVFTFSGIRPLPKSGHAFTGRISRGHSIHRIDGAVPQFCMIGGKWTTFRAFAAQGTEAVLAELGATRRRDTLELPIGGGANFPGESSVLIEELTSRFAITGQRAAYLVDLYGTRARDVMEFCRARSDDTRLSAGIEMTAAEIAMLARHEFVTSLSDILLRRTPLAITGHVSAGLIEQIADVLSEELRWSRERRVAEVLTAISELETFHGVSREMLKHRTKNGVPHVDKRESPLEQDVYQRQMP